MTSEPTRPVRWLDSAFVDLAEISDFIARHSIIAAVHVSDGIQDKADMLGAHPYLGEQIPRLHEMRRVFWHDYIICYTVHPHEIVVRAVIHGSRRFPAKLLRDRLRRP